MQRKLVVMAAVMMAVLWLIACGREATAPEAAPTSVSTVATATEAEMPATPTVAETPVIEAVAETVSDACPEYFRFCTAVQISGALTAETRAGVGGSFGSCAEWAAGGAERILELPIVLAAGDPPITVALTRLGSYTDAG